MKYKKANTFVKIKISDHVSLIMNPKFDNDMDLMVAIGMLTEMYALNHKLNNKNFDIDIFKKMMCEYIDKVVELE